MEVTKINARQQNGYKWGGHSYRTLNGKHFEQWADRSTKEELEEIIAEDQSKFAGAKFVIRKQEGFYRLFKSND